MARPSTGKNGNPVNLYLSPETKQQAQELARDFYGKSLSFLVEKLLNAEISLRKRKAKYKVAKALKGAA